MDGYWDDIDKETRYTMLTQSEPNAATRLVSLAQYNVAAQRRYYEHLAAMPGAAPVVAHG